MRNYEMAGDVSQQDLKSFGLFADPLQAVSFPCPLVFNSQQKLSAVCLWTQAETDKSGLRRCFFSYEEISISAYSTWGARMTFCSQGS